MNIPTWVWWLAGIAGIGSFLVAFVFLGAVRLGAVLDDMQAELRREERQRAALGRAAASASNVVPIRRHSA